MNDYKVMWNRVFGQNVILWKINLTVLKVAVLTVPFPMLAVDAKGIQVIILR